MKTHVKFYGGAIDLVVKSIAEQKEKSRNWRK